MQNDSRKQDIIQELRKKQEITEEVCDVPSEATGTVTDCLWLNVREHPDKDSKVVAVISALTQVSVDETLSTEDFYKVTTSDGVVGFCMKKYIALSR